VAALAASTLFAAQEVTTPPVGFITVNITGAATAPAKALRYNLVGINMVNPVEFQGLSGVGALVAGKTQLPLTGITASAFPTSNKYFLEVVSGVNEGLMIDVDSVVDGTVNLAENVQSAFGSAVTVAIRKHNTLASIFGSGANVVLKGEEAANLADEVQVFNPVTQVGTNYYFDTFVGAWVQSGFDTDKGNTVLYPDQGVLVIRRGGPDVSFKVVGSVKTGKTQVTIEKGYNLVTYPYPVESSIGSSGFYNTATPSTSLKGEESANLADEVQFFNSTSQAGVNYYFDTFVDGWVQSGFDTSVSNSLKLPIGSAVLVIRKGSTATSLSLPQPF
jgi:uncharacterized protein (TIGR02597 family)